MISGIKEKFEDFLAGLDETQKSRLKGVSVVAGGIILIVAFNLFTSDPPPPPQQKQQEAKIEETRVLSSNRYDSLSGEVVNSKIGQLENSLKTTVEESRNQTRLLASQLAEERERARALEQQLMAINEQINSNAKTSEAPGLNNSDIRVLEQAILKSIDRKLEQQKEELKAEIGVVGGNATSGLGFSQGGFNLRPSQKGDGGALVLKVYEKKKEEPTQVAMLDNEEVVEEDEDEGMYLPAGTIFSGVLLSGVTAPTYSGAKEDPRPFLARVKKEAILPNKFSMDIEECFIVGSGFAELSEERFNARTEALSCITKDKGVIEVSLDAYAVGEDSKAGLRGRLVSREGAMIARSMTASFLEGVGSAFRPVGTLGSTVQSSANPFDLPSADQVGQATALNGAASAMEKLANYYASMAETMYPVLEIDSTREVSFVLTRGVFLQLQ